MWLSESYPISPASIQNQITAYLSGLIPAGAVDSGICAIFAVVTAILATLGYRHALRGKWLNGWLSGPSAVLTALIAASYGDTGLPSLAGIDPLARDPKSLLTASVVALLAGALVTAAAWPVAMHVAAYRGRPVSPLELRDWAQTTPLHAAGGAGAGALLAWAVDPLLIVAGAALGLLITWLVEHLRGPQVSRSESAGDAHATEGTPAPVPEHRAARAPVPPPISDEW